MTDHHFKTLQRLKRRFHADVIMLTPFKTPGWEQEKSYVLEMTQWSSNGSQTETAANKMSTCPTSSSDSSSSHRVHLPRSPSSSPPAQLSPREHLVSPNTEDHTAPKKQKIIRPQDIDKQPTSGLAALVQETSPLAPYKIQCSAKRRARQMLSNMC